MSEIEFSKYASRGPGYHWSQVSLNPRTRNAFVLARYRACCDLLGEYAGELEGRTVLDLGCGDGVLTSMLAQRGALCRGVDLDESAVMFAREKLASLGLAADLVVGSCYDLQFDDRSFDAVVSSEVVEHVGDVQRYLSEIARVLRQDGIAVISTPVRRTRTPSDPMHVQEWFEEDFKELCEGTFSSVELRLSHATVAAELYRSRIGRWAINAMSYFYNPFRLGNSGSQALQFAICR